MAKSVDLRYWVRVFIKNLSMNGQVGGSRVFGNNLSIMAKPANLGYWVRVSGTI